MESEDDTIDTEEESKGRDPELEKRIEEAFQKIDWDIMKKHLKSKRARKQFDDIKKQSRFHFSCIHTLSGYTKLSNPLTSYYKRLYPKPAVEDLRQGKSIQRKLLAKGQMLMKGNFLHTLGLGSALALSLTGLYVANRKDGK